MSKQSSENQIVIISAVCAIACAALIVFVHLRQGNIVYAATQPIEISQQATTPADYEIPLCTAGQQEQRIANIGYQVSYNSDWHLPNWVAYQLTAEDVAGEEARSNKFLPDPLVDGAPCPNVRLYPFRFRPRTHGAGGGYEVVASGYAGIVLYDQYLSAKSQQ